MLNSVVDEELELLLEAIYKQYGHDYRDYSRAHIRRRLNNHMRLAGYDTMADLQELVLNDRNRASALLQDLSITVTEMFRDPDFYRAVREKVVPMLRTWSHIRIWHAGCSTGEEVYSMAILLKEAGLYERARIYATDMNPKALERAAEGIYPLDKIRGYSRNYQRSGAAGSFAEHCLAGYGSAIMDQSLKKNIVWAEHNLVTDSDFAEVQMVVCRNVMIYFNRKLQHRVHAMFKKSLVNGGILCLGAKESIEHTDQHQNYTAIDQRHKIYKKKYSAG